MRHVPGFISDIKLRDRVLAICILGIILIPVGLPYLLDGYQYGHDRLAPYFRVTALVDSLKSSRFPPRWFNEFDGGYGSPYPSFYAMSFYYLAALLTSLNMSVGVSVEVAAFIIMALSGLAMYIFLDSVWGPVPALLGAALYVFAPYHLVDAYVRASYSELTAFIWFPLIGYGTYSWIIGNKSRHALIAAISICGLILSHNLMAFIFLPFAAVLPGFLLFAEQKTWLQRRKKFLGIGMIWVVGLMLSAYFWLPVLEEARFLRIDYFFQFDLQDEFNNLRNLINTTSSHELTTEAGIILLGLGVSSIIQFFDQKRNAGRGVFLWAVFGAVGALFMTSDRSAFIWQALPFIDFVQFPWRFLAPSVFFLGVLSAAFINGLRSERVRWSLVLVLIGISVYLYRPLVNIPKRISEERLASSAICMDVWDTQDYRPVFSKFPFWRDVNPPQVEAGETNLVPCANSIQVEASGVFLEVARFEYPVWMSNYAAQNATTITLPQYYFPGWTAEIDGSEIPLGYNQQSGFITLRIPKGNHRIVVKYQESPVRRLANVVSLAGLVSLLVLPKLNFGSGKSRE